MARKIVVQSEGKLQLLAESLADDEFQLQELIKANPDLLPVEEFGMETPLLVIGRETALRSGAVDLVALAKSGELLIVEFKTGPQNTDFRHALSQLVDYGSDLWGMDYDTFEQTVPVRYFGSMSCQDEKYKGLKHLADAVEVLWDISGEDFEPLAAQIRKQLESGEFHYLLVAQRFTSTIEKSIEYMNAKMSGPRFYAVELVRFANDGLNAFESRTILKPAPDPPGGGPRTKITIAEFLAEVPEGDYRQFLEELLDTCTGLKLAVQPGDRGLSIRIPFAGARPPFSIGWLFPPDRVGWKKFTDVTLGYVRGKIESPPEALLTALAAYSASIGAVPGARRVADVKFDAHTLEPEQAMRGSREIIGAIEDLVGAFQRHFG